MRPARGSLPARILRQPPAGHRVPGLSLPIEHPLQPVSRCFSYTEHGCSLDRFRESAIKPELSHLKKNPAFFQVRPGVLLGL